jgi:hypothetical protein
VVIHAVVSHADDDNLAEGPRFAAPKLVPTTVMADAVTSPVGTVGAFGAMSWEMMGESYVK